MTGYEILDETIQSDPVEMRKAYTETLMEIAEKDENIVAMDADLMRAMGILPFAAKFPERTIDCGIMEGAMFSIASGLSMEGKIPFAHTFGVFTSRRACDQIYLSCAYAGLNVKVIGSDPGVTAAINGGTHMAFEDVGIFRVIPGMTIIEPTDSVMMRDMIRQVGKEYGMYYLRLVRKSVPKIYQDDSRFTIGRANLLRKGKDIAIFAAGIMVAESLEAAKQLANEGIDVRVYDMFTIKPIDKEAIIEAAKETGAIVTAENHNVINGLGSAVAEVLAEKFPVPMKRIGVQDSFGEVGPRSYLQERFHLTAADVVYACKEVLARKGQ